MGVCPFFCLLVIPFVCLSPCWSVHWSICLPLFWTDFLCSSIYLSSVCCFCLPAFPSICSSVHLPIHLPACMLSICIYVCLLTHPSVCLSAHTFVFLSLNLSICLSVCLFFCLHTYLSTHPSKSIHLICPFPKSICLLNEYSFCFLLCRSGQQCALPYRINCHSFYLSAGLSLPNHRAHKVLCLTVMPCLKDRRLTVSLPFWLCAAVFVCLTSWLHLSSPHTPYTNISVTDVVHKHTVSLLDLYSV